MTDEDIIKSYQSTGDKTKLTSLFKKYTGDLFGLSYYYLSDRDRAMDVVMDVYEAVLKVVDDKDITHYKAWLMSICRNTCLKRLRDHKSYAQLTDFSESFMEKDDEREYSDELIDQLMDNIKKLQPDQKVCIEAFYLKKMSYADIEKIFNYDNKAVKSHVQNGKRNLKIMFDKQKRE